MNALDAYDLVLAAAKAHAQIREDDADATDEERLETAELWEAIDIVGGVTL